LPLLKITSLLALLAQLVALVAHKIHMFALPVIPTTTSLVQAALSAVTDMFLLTLPLHAIPAPHTVKLA
jgi:hypothetical protein